MALNHMSVSAWCSNVRWCDSFRLGLAPSRGLAARLSCGGLLGGGLGWGGCAAACGWRPGCRALSEKVPRLQGLSPLKHWGNAYVAKVAGNDALFHVVQAGGRKDATITHRNPRNGSLAPATPSPAPFYRADHPQIAGPRAQLRRQPTAPTPQPRRQPTQPRTPQGHATFRSSRSATIRPFRQIESAPTDPVTTIAGAHEHLAPRPSTSTVPGSRGERSR